MDSGQQKIILGEGTRVWTGRLDHHLQMFNTTNGNARIPEKDLKECSSEVCPDKGRFFSSMISSKQASTLIIPCPVAAGRCSFQLMSSNALMPAAVSSSPSVNLQPQARGS